MELQKQIDLGVRAQNAYDGYIREHITVCKQKIFAQLEVTQLDESVLRLKRLLDALIGLEKSVINDIDNGKIAKQQIEESKNE